MTNQQHDHDFDHDRRSFASRTPVNNNPDKVVYRRGFVTRHQVTGWRFVMRRIAAGIALHDTRMLVDPLRTQSRAVLMGVLIVITGLIGSFVFSLIRPNGQAGSNAVLADRATAALYVRVGEQLHPVLNLTSARLIVGRPVSPTTVKSTELDQFPRGNLIGIPGAPERMVQNTSTDANWTVCDGLNAPSRGGADGVGVTVIAGPLEDTGARAAALGPGQAVLVDSGAGTWLLWDGKRSPIDLADHAVTSGLGLGADVPAPRIIASGLFNAIPEAPPLTAPIIPDAGNPASFGVPAPIGAVVSSYALKDSGKTISDTVQYYAVLPDGLQQISPVLAAILRNNNSYGLQQPPRLGADEVAKLPVSRVLDTRRYPSEPVSLAAGTGYFTQTVGGGPDAPGAGSLFWVSDTGVRYGIDNEPQGVAGGGKAVEALGLNPPPVPIPWSVLSMFVPGPTLSRADALLAHDTLVPDSRPARPVSAEGGYR
ncbi:ESX-3 secretion system protein EccB3 [Mycobacterium tuberculosis variant bovis B2 7505]|nr:ESX-3 secretion system protein EccB3 [Mycobacterium tuberculosis variant bovis B2 7505]